MISHGQFEKEFLEKVRHSVEIEFELTVKNTSSYVDLMPFFDPSRRQYDANKLLKLIDSVSAANSFKTIGLFHVDLFIPILTYIFGQAAFKGNAGVVSIYRLKNEQYGLKSDNVLLLDRFRKVIIHELGHTFGLVHCHVPSCVMRSTTYVEDIDQKKHHFCSKCRSELESVISILNSSG